MANSTSPVYDSIIQSQAGKEITANAYFDAASPSILFGRRQSASSGLTWAYHGGTILVDGVPTQIINGSLVLTGGSALNNYIEATRAGIISANTTGFTPGRIPLYLAVCGSSTVTSYTDNRAWVQPKDMTSKVSVAVTATDVTLSADQARCRYLTTTGVLTGNRSVIVPNDWEGIVYCSNTGAFTTTIKTAGGSGVVVAQTKRACLLADGTNVVRVTADV